MATLYFIAIPVQSRTIVFNSTMTSNAIVKGQIVYILLNMWFVRYCVLLLVNLLALAGMISMHVCQQNRNVGYPSDFVGGWAICQNICPSIISRGWHPNPMSGKYNSMNGACTSKDRSWLEFLQSGFSGGQIAQPTHTKSEGVLINISYCAPVNKQQYTYYTHHICQQHTICPTPPHLQLYYCWYICLWQHLLI